MTVRILDGMGLTLPQLCHNYLLLVFESVNWSSVTAANAEFIHLVADGDTQSRYGMRTENPRVAVRLSREGNLRV